MAALGCIGRSVESRQTFRARNIYIYMCIYICTGDIRTYFNNIDTIIRTNNNKVVYETSMLQESSGYTERRRPVGC